MQGLLYISSLHPFLHFALFIGGIVREPEIIGNEPHDIPQSEWNQIDFDMKELVYWMQYGHLAEVGIALLNLVLHAKKLDQHAAILAVICHILGYLGPMIRMCYYLNTNYQQVCHFDTPYTGWMFIEVQVFVCWIVTSFIFLVMVNLSKYRGKWQQLQAHNLRNIWRQKDIDDFLHYLRHEYSVFCLCFCLTLFDISELFYIWGLKIGSVDFRVMDTVIMGLMQLSRYMSFGLLAMQIHSDQSKSHQIKIWVTLGARIIIQLGCIGLFVWLWMAGNRRFMVLYGLINLITTLLLLVQDLYVQANLTWVVR